MIRNSAREMILYYNPQPSSKVIKLKGVLVRMGIRIRNVGPEQVMETVGALAGLAGFEKVGNLEEQGNENPAKVIPEEVLVMHGFTSRRIDELLAALRKAGVPKVELKAIITPTNASWTFYHLYEEIKEEHERMKQSAAEPQK